MTTELITSKLFMSSSVLSVMCTLRLRFGRALLAFSALRSSQRPAYRLVCLDRIGDRRELALLRGAFWTTLQCISSLHQERVESISDRRRWARAVCRVHPFGTGERITELLELPDGCNALFVDDAHGLFRRGGLCDTISASVELPRPATLPDECSDGRPRQHKNDGRATYFIELSQNMPDSVRDHHAVFHFQNEGGRNGTEDK